MPSILDPRVVAQISGVRSLPQQVTPPWATQAQQQQQRLPQLGLFSDPRMQAVALAAAAQLSSPKGQPVFAQSLGSQLPYIRKMDIQAQERERVKNYLRMERREDLIPLVDAGETDTALSMLKADKSGSDESFEKGISGYYTKDGKQIPYQLGSKGTRRDINFGEGETPVDTFQKIDLGNRIVVVDRRTNQQIGEYLKSGTPEEGTETIQGESGLEYRPVPGSKGYNEAVKTQRGKSVVSQTIDAAADAWVSLDKAGGVRNYKDPAAERFIEGLGTTSPGRAMGGILGTEASGIRSQIENIQPALLNAIKQAAEISGRGLDSNRELEFYIRQQGALTGDIFANLVALEVLDRTIGTGNGIIDRLPEKYRDEVRRRAAIDMQSNPALLEWQRREGGQAAPGNGISGQTSNGVPWSVVE